MMSNNCVEMASAGVNWLFSAGGRVEWTVNTYIQAKRYISRLRKNSDVSDQEELSIRLKSGLQDDQNFQRGVTR